MDSTNQGATTPPPTHAANFASNQHDPIDLENRITKLETTVKLLMWVVGISIPVIATIVQIVFSLIESGGGG